MVFIRFKTPIKWYSHCFYIQNIEIDFCLIDLRDFFTSLMKQIVFKHLDEQKDQTLVKLFPIRVMKFVKQPMFFFLINPAKCPRVETEASTKAKRQNSCLTLPARSFFQKVIFICKIFWRQLFFSSWNLLLFMESALNILKNTEIQFTFFL